MKSIHSRKAGLAAFAVAALLYAAPVSAQTHLMRVNIPFQFAAGNEVLPAGEYEVVLDPFARILLRNSAQTSFIALSAKSERGSGSNLSPGALWFDRYADTLFLIAAWTPGHEEGKTVRPSGRLAESMRAGLGKNIPARVILGSGPK